MKKYDVFISHSSKDRAAVETIVNHLESNGVTCFVSYRDIPICDNWAAILMQAIEDSTMVVYVHTESANASPQVEREIQIAIDRYKMPCISYRLTSQPFEGAKAFFIQTLNWIDSLVSPEQGFDALLASVRDILAGKEAQTIEQDYNSFSLFIRRNKIALIVAACVLFCVAGGLIAKKAIDQSRIKKAAELELAEFQGALKEYNASISTAKKLIDAKDSASVIIGSIENAEKVATRYNGTDHSDSFTLDTDALREQAMSAISDIAADCRQKIINFNMTYQLVPMEEVKKDIELEIAKLSECNSILGQDFDNTISRIKSSLGL